MFGHFKEKLQLVQQDLSASFKTLTIKAREVGIGKRIPEHSAFPDSSVNIKPCRYEAGAELLNKFQSSWAVIHNDIETSAARATAVDSYLNEVLRDYEKRTESLHQLHKHLHELPTMMQDIQALTVTVGRLEASFEELEDMIINYEDLIEREEFKKNQINKQKELHKYESQKDSEYARTKAHLQAENEQLVKEFEKAEEAKMKERQQAFEEVFAAEMNHYKQHGKINEKVVNRDKKSVSSIDDFEFQVDDADQMALDDFLGAEVSTKTKVSEKLPELNEVVEINDTSFTEYEEEKQMNNQVNKNNEMVRTIDEEIDVVQNKQIADEILEQSEEEIEKEADKVIEEEMESQKEENGGGNSDQNEATSLNKDEDLSTGKTGSDQESY